MGKKLIEVTGIKKLFSGVVAREGIDIELLEGEVHALMGENGAGKSTLAKIISGIYQADGGTMLVEGEPMSFSNTREAVGHGVSIVTQEFSLLPDFSIAENIFLTDETYYKGGFLSDRKSMAKKTIELLALFQMENELDPYEKVRNLSVAQMQVIEILKAVSTNAKTIILDEPTASLSTKEIDQLFDIVRKLKKEGVGFIIVSHKINEIYEISDRITVLRDGRLILNGVKTAELEQNELIKAMVGREVKNLYGERNLDEQKDWGKEEVVLEAQDITDSTGYLKDISFQLHKGEIIGFSGLVGAGRSELVRCVFGADVRTKGKVFLHGKEVRANSIKASMARQIGFVSEDRKRDGLLQEVSVIKNIGLAKLAASNRAILDFKEEQKDCDEMIQQMRIKVADVDMPVKSLSGGNQQKVLLAKWILLNPEVLIVDEPTRGVDIGAKADIYAILKRLAAQGMSIIVVSSEIPEIQGICDTIYVMCEGRVTGVLDASEAEEEKIGYYSTMG
ncbi:MAG: sugar ABC transporter ATP-binding protein [Lachnospiraceae bacterium]|nr:sugar ABC transporter ATP-binding protein [Lachnospiraceae bacterium]